MTKSKSHKKLLMISASVAVVLLLVAIGVFAYLEWTARAEGLERLVAATELLEQADTVVIEVDEVVRGDITPELGLRASAAASAAPDAIGDLEEAIRLLRRARPDLPEPQAREAVALTESAEARLELLEDAPVILEANVFAAKALEPARAAWGHILEGERLKDQATTEYNKLTRASVTRSQQLNTQAEASFGKAVEQFRIADQAFPESRMKDFIDYAESNLRLLTLSKQADAAFLAGRVVQANRLAADVNKKDREIVAQLAKLPDTPETAIAGAYERLAGEATERYFRARDRATEADAALEVLTQ